VSSAIATIAEAIKDALNGEDFSMDFTAARVYRPSYDLKDVKDLTVVVAPRANEITLLNRRDDQYEVTVQIGVLKKLDDEDNAEIDPLMALVQEICEFLSRKAMGTGLWLSTKNDPIYLAEHLHQYRQFTSVITATYRVMEGG